MTIGNHTWDHPEHPPFRDLPAEKIRSEMQKNDRRAAQARRGPVPVPAARAGPTGPELGVAQSLGMRVVLWSIDPQDWRSDIKPKEIVDNVLSHVHAGSIVLMHDGGGLPGRDGEGPAENHQGHPAKGLDIVAVPR